MSRDARPPYRSGLGWILGFAFGDTLTRPVRLAQGFTFVRCHGSPRASSPHGLTAPGLASLDGIAACSCLWLAVATNSPREGLSPPIQCPCQARLLSLLLAPGRAPMEALTMVAFALAATGAVVLASRASGALAKIVGRTMGTSGQLPMRLTVSSLILLILLSKYLRIDMALGALVAGALVRAAIERRHDEAMAARMAGLGSAFLIPVFFVTSGVKLDVGSLFSSPAALAMVPFYAALMLIARGLPAMLLYRADLTFQQRV